MNKPDKNCILCHTFPPQNPIELYDEFICNSCLSELLKAREKKFVEIQKWVKANKKCKHHRKPVKDHLPWELLECATREVSY